MAGLLTCASPFQAFAAEPTIDCPSADELRREALEIINALRAGGRECGSRRHPPAAPLSWSQRLAEAAQRHADDMARRGYFAHNTPEGLTPGKRADATGYDWAHFGENIASGQRSVTDVFRSWLESPRHCEAIMKAEFRDVALGCAPGTEGLKWALELGRLR